MLGDLPIPKLDGARLHTDTLYLSLTKAEYEEYSHTLVSYLLGREDIYHKVYQYSTGLVGGIFFLPEKQCAPLTEDYTDFSKDSQLFVFSIADTHLENGDRIPSAISVSLTRRDGTIGKDDTHYNTVITLNPSIANAAFYPCGVGHTPGGEGEKYVIPHSQENAETVTLYRCIYCDSLEASLNTGDTKEYTLTVSEGEEYLYVAPRKQVYSGFIYTICTRSMPSFTVTVLVNGVELTKSRNGEYWYEYDFITPSADLDVKITVTPKV